MAGTATATPSWSSGTALPRTCRLQLRVPSESAARLSSVTHQRHATAAHSATQPSLACTRRWRRRASTLPFWQRAERRVSLIWQYVGLCFIEVT